ncbi:MAG: FKBP-type peptidyl-prolyl cis-trans isomerase [Nanoarchaeota archaeon]|nr:FKBP-type peptidyl-prolyl cis-trans isomerase [Nanoarchaeota archaeon]
MVQEEIKKGDFVEIEYVGRIRDTEKVFDLTDAEVAKKEGIYRPDSKYGPVIICVGYRDVVSGLDDGLVGNKIGSEIELEVVPEKGFGKKKTELIRLVPLNIFTERGVRPVPGVQFSFDGVVGTVRSVSGGRILVDFNHPLSGKVLKYYVKIIRSIESDKEKVEGFLRNILKDFSVEIRDGHAIIFAEIKEGFDKKLSEEIKKRIPTLKLVEFKKKSDGGEKKPIKKVTASQK